MCPLQRHHLAATCPCADDVPSPLLCPLAVMCPRAETRPPASSPPFTPAGPSSLRENHAGTERWPRRWVAQRVSAVVAPLAKPLLGASVQLLKIESENIPVPHPDREKRRRGGPSPPPPAAGCPGASPPTLLPCHLRPLCPQAGGARPQGQGGSLRVLFLGELLQRLAQILHKRKNSRQVALPNLVIPSPAAFAAPSAAISSPRSPPRGGDREERFCFGKRRAESTPRRPRRAGLGRGPLPDSPGFGRCCRGPVPGPGGKNSTPLGQAWGQQKAWHLGAVVPPSGRHRNLTFCKEFGLEARKCK